MLDLDAYTDPQAMRARLQPRLAEIGLAGAPIERLRVMHALRRAPRRHPGSGACRIAVCYEAQFGAPAARSEILYGKVYPAEAACRAVLAAGDAAAPAWLEDIEMLVWRFPDDPGLPQLAGLLDAACGERTLPSGLALHGLRGARLLRYRPEERATLAWRSAEGLFYSKTFAGDEGAALPQRFAHFHGREDAFEVAEPLGYDAPTRSFWARGVAAEALADVVTPQNLADWMERVAAALAALHAAPLAVAATHHVSGLVDAARKRAAKIARAVPECGPQARALAECIAAAAPRHAGVPLGLIHGDFHADQLRVRGRRLVLFDFDEFARGDPLQDLASFAVKCRHPDRRIAAAMPLRLAEAYARQRPAAFDGARYAWHLAVQWLHKASRAFVWQQPGWRAAVRAMLGEAVAVAGGRDHGRA